MSYPVSDLETFCTSGVYIPFCVIPDNIVVLIINNQLVRGALYEKSHKDDWPKELVDRLKERAKKELDAWERPREEWLNMKWKLREISSTNTKRKKKKKKKGDKKVALFNLTRGDVLHVTESEDGRSIEGYLNELAEGPKELLNRLQRVISFTKLLRNLYVKYDR